MIIIYLAAVVKFTHLSSKEAGNKCYVKYVFWKFLKKPYKTIKESISSHAAGLFDSKSTQSALGHSNVTRGALKGNFEHLKGTRRALEGHLNTWDNRVLEWHLGTQALEGHFDTKALIHLGTHTSRHVIYQAPSKMANNPNFLLGYVTEMTNERLE